MAAPSCASRLRARDGEKLLLRSADRLVVGRPCNAALRGLATSGRVASDPTTDGGNHCVLKLTINGLSGAFPSRWWCSWTEREGSRHLRRLADDLHHLPPWSRHRDQAVWRARMSSNTRSVPTTLLSREVTRKKNGSVVMSIRLVYFLAVSFVFVGLCADGGGARVFRCGGRRTETHLWRPFAETQRGSSASLRPGPVGSDFSTSCSTTAVSDGQQCGFHGSGNAERETQCEAAAGKGR